ncbi:MAG: cytochrome c [Candidatus Obscuribacterales bacterium]|nr:cytochrome c [Candidatus Obscuribacterales bacterium]
MKFWNSVVILLACICFASNAAVYSSSPGRKKTDSSKADIAQGEALFKAACVNCHSTGKTGGCLGPILAGEGSRRSRDFIESRISNDPKKVAAFLRLYAHAELMPHLRVPAESARKLAAYVASLPSTSSGVEVKPHGKNEKASVAGAGAEQSDSDKAKSIEQGKRLVYERGCLMCHSFGGFGGQFAPAFDGIGSRHSKDYIAESITNAELLIGKSGNEYGGRGLVMPPSSFSQSDIDRIAEYLSSLK